MGMDFDAAVFQCRDCDFFDTSGRLVALYIPGGPYFLDCLLYSESLCKEEEFKTFGLEGKSIMNVNV